MESKSLKFPRRQRGRELGDWGKLVTSRDDVKLGESPWLKSINKNLTAKFCRLLPKKHSSMEPEIYKFRLKKNYETIVRDLEPKKLVGFLYQDDIFDEDDMDEVRSERTRKKQAEQLLKMLSTKEVDGYTVLVRALEEKQPHLARLMNTPVPDEKLLIRQSGKLITFSL